MKINWESIGWTALLIFVFFPWVIGIVDVIACFITGNFLTNIDWHSLRGQWMLAWPIMWTLGIFIMGCLVVG